jgi:hypothetical protein
MGRLPDAWRSRRAAEMQGERQLQDRGAYGRGACAGNRRNNIFVPRRPAVVRCSGVARQLSSYPNMSAHPKSVKPVPRQRADGRRQLLIYLAPEVIKDVKKIAVDDDTTASSITEEALRDWLERRVKKLTRRA